ncbi:hypothetical protein ZWY2020_047917 [Hordeum vulgare]|nr:hypothetical protein ZWY2020_047917 [Hordeum vulgare]
MSNAVGRGRGQVQKEDVRWRRGRSGRSHLCWRVTNEDGLRTPPRLDNATVAVGRGRGRISLTSWMAASHCSSTQAPPRPAHLPGLLPRSRRAPFSCRCHEYGGTLLLGWIEGEVSHRRCHESRGREVAVAALNPGEGGRRHV